MEKKHKLDLSKYETLSQNRVGQLVNGFSNALDVSFYIGGTGNNNNTGCTNNCAGGNCVAHCGGQ